MRTAHLTNIIDSIDRKQALQGSITIGIFLVASIVASRLIGQDQIEHRVEQAGVRGPAILILWKAISVIFAPFSGAVVYAISGAVYGMTDAILYNLYGNIIGVSCAFLIGRWRGKTAVARLVGKTNIDEVVHLVGHLENLKTYTICRILLFPLEDLLNYAAGMSRIRFLPFLIITSILTTLISLIPILLGHVLIE